MNRVMGCIILIFKILPLSDRFDNKKKDSRSLIQDFGISFCSSDFDPYGKYWSCVLSL